MRKSFKPEVSWQYFALDKLNSPAESTFFPELEKSGRGIDFDFQGEFNFSSILNTGEHLLLTGRFSVPSAGVILAGVAGDGIWSLYFNGKLILDTRGVGNNEYPLQADNHLFELDCVPGENRIQLLLPANGEYMTLICKLLEPGPELTMQYGPFVSFPDSSENAVSVIFSATAASPAAVEYKKPDDPVWQRVYDNLGGQMRHNRNMHHIRLSGLEPGSLYQYRVVLINDRRCLSEWTDETIYSFTAPPEHGQDLEFLVTADLQNVPMRMEFFDLLFQKKHPEINPDFFAFAGDLYWSSNFNRSIMEEFIEPFRQKTGNKLPLVMVRGNHEIYGKESNTYFDYFTPPGEGKEGYYLFRWGDVCFFVLDFCDDDAWMPPPSTRQFHDFEPYIAAEARWLKKAVQLDLCKSAKYRIVLAHGVPVGDPEKYMPGHVRQVIDPLFSGKDPAVKIHLWLGGHVHRPFRSVPFTNCCYSMVDPAAFKTPHPPVGENYGFPVVITGGPLKATGDHLQFTSISVKVNDDRITVVSRDRFMQEFDRFSILPDGSITDEKSSREFQFYESFCSR